MFGKRYFYYLISISFGIGLIYGIQRTDSILPVTPPKPKLTVAAPKLFSILTENHPLLVQWRFYDTDSELKELLAEVDFLLFFSTSLPVAHHEAQIPLNTSLDAISTDFLGLRFDRSNRYFLPLGWRLQSNQLTDDLVLLLGTKVKENPHTGEFLEHLISNEFQTKMANLAKLGTVLKEEINASEEYQSKWVRTRDLSRLRLLTEAQ